MNVVNSSPQTVEFSGVDGLTLVADEWNRGATDRPTILMLHGGGQNRFSWKNTGQILADDGFHVVALDSRGHGDSDRAPNADYDVETLTADVMHVLGAIGRPVAIIGASMGGLTGILAAHRAGPARVTKLVLVDVVPRFEKGGSARIRDFMFSGLDGFDSLEQAADAVRGRIDWKYALGLELTDPGVDFSVLSEFRTRLVRGSITDLLLETLLEACRTHGWVKPRGRQRTDSTHVLGALRVLNRLAHLHKELKPIRRRQ